jgi:hypothetical protein
VACDPLVTFSRLVPSYSQRDAGSPGAARLAMTTSRSSSSFAAWILAAAAMAFAGHAMAQCPPQWVAGDGTAGIDGVGSALVQWDPDGAGPQTPKVVVGGRFAMAGRTPATNIAVYDPLTGDWSALGAGLYGATDAFDIAQVDALVALPDGSLVAGGRFTTAGGVPAKNIARWNGNS